jgi:uncharacterized RDD family membrane protein YckC
VLPVEPAADPHFPAQLPLNYPPAVGSLIPGVLISDGVAWRPAGFWSRTAAFLLDCILLTLVTDIVILASGIALPDAQQMLALFRKLVSELVRSGALSSQATVLLEQARTASGFAAWINLAVCATYFTVMHGIAGTTLGKAACGLRLLRSDHKPLGIGWACLRYCAYFLAAKLAYTAWVMPFDRERRTLYDLLLKTNVYHKLPD